MKRKTIILCSLLFICANYAQVGNQFYSGIYFINENVGLINWRITPDSENVFKTTNGGLSWADANLPVNWMGRIFFLNDHIGFMQGFLKGDPKLLKTTNRGTTWNIISDIDAGFYHFINEDVGYALKYIFNEYVFRSKSVLIKTTDGGFSWVEVRDLPYYTYLWAHGIDDITLIGSEVDSNDEIVSGFIIRSKDKNYDHHFSTGCYGISFIDSLKGFISSDSKLYQTIDGGLSWNIIPDIPGGITIFTDSLNGFIDRGYSLGRTTDAGRTWKLNLHETPNNRYRCYLDSIHIFEENSANGSFCKSSDGGYTWECLPVNIISSVKENFAPQEYSLKQNYPNPFNPSTTIKYSIPVKSFVDISIYNILGSKVAELVNQEKLAGEYEVNWNVSSLPSGVYFCKLKAGSFTQSRKLLLLK